MGQNKNTLRECVKLAGEIIDQGKAKQKLDEFINLTQMLGKEEIKN